MCRSAQTCSRWTAGEVRAVVGVEHVGEPAHRPRRPVLAPDRLAQRERGLQRRRRPEEHDVACDSAAVVILDHRQPRTRRALLVVEDEQVKLGVVGLPDLVGALGLAAVDKLEALAVAHRPVVREHEQPRVKRAHDRVDRGVARRRPLMRARDGRRLTMDIRDRRRGPAQREPFDQLDELGHGAPLPAVRARR